MLWKLGVLSFDPSFYMTMGQDASREALVVGLTEAELRARFGRLRTPRDATERQAGYTRAHVARGEDVVWLGDSQWLVVLEDGRGRRLCLEKG